MKPTMTKKTVDRLKRKLQKQLENVILEDPNAGFGDWIIEDSKEEISVSQKGRTLTLYPEKSKKMRFKFRVVVEEA